MTLLPLDSMVIRAAPLQIVQVATVWAGQEVPPLVAPQELTLDARQSLHRRCAGEEHLPSRERRGALLGERHGVPLPVDIPGVLIHLVHDQEPDRPGAEAGARGGAGADQDSALELHYLVCM